VKFEDVVFLEVDEVHEAHRDAVANFGGLAGVRDPGLIESATWAPRSGYYVSLAEMAAAYAWGLAKNHGFVDGNKRTSALAMVIFLRANGFKVSLDSSWEATVVAVADKSLSRGDLVQKITDLMGGNPEAIEF
jgi:death-on-curing protein